jgi:hypothetical protein
MAELIAINCTSALGEVDPRRGNALLSATLRDLLSAFVIASLRSFPSYRFCNDRGAADIPRGHD